MTLLSVVPSPSIAPPRWPGLVASVGGEAAIKAFMAANPAEGGPRRWEGGITFSPNDCDFVNDNPVDGCTQGVQGIPVFDIDDEGSAGTNIDVYPLYYWEVSRCSSLSTDPASVERRARLKADRAFSHKLENEFWNGTTHVDLNLAGQYLTDAPTEVNAGIATPLVYALSDLQSAWAGCSYGERAMIHATIRTINLWVSAGVVRRESGLLLDAFDNIVVAGTGYTGSDPDGNVDVTYDTAWAYVSPVVNIRLGDTEVITNFDHDNNEHVVIAFKPAAVYHDDCCVYGINVDHVNTCGS